MGLKYSDLIKPYEDPTPPGVDKRTPEGQREWLLKRGIPEQIVNEAMESVYTDISSGRVFRGSDDHPSGYFLDRCLLETSRKILRGKEMAKLSAQNYEQVDGYVARSWKDRAIDIGIGAAGALSTAVAAYFLWL